MDKWSAAVLSKVEAALLYDPGERGIAPLLCAGHFARVIHELAGPAVRSILIFTGFIVPTMQETDGPAGAVYIALALRVLHPAADIAIVIEESSVPMIERMLRVALGADLAPSVVVRGYPLAEAGSSRIAHDLSTGTYSAVTHLLAIERAGPAVSSPGGAYRSMRGMDITHLHAPLHLLWDGLRAQNSPTFSVGIGDGGNEIGMGLVEDRVVRHIPLGLQIANRCSADVLIVAGVSNWGGMALLCCLLPERAEEFLALPDFELLVVGESVRCGAVDPVLLRKLQDGAVPSAGGVPPTAASAHAAAATASASSSSDLIWDISVDGFAVAGPEHSEFRRRLLSALNR